MVNKPLKSLNLLCLILTCSLPVLQAQEDVKKDLTPAELSDVKSGKLIIKTRELDDLPWPELTMYKIIDAGAFESMAIFSALDYQKVYVPNMLKSEVVRQISPIEVHTAYEMRVPFPFPNAKYTNGSVISKKDIGGEVVYQTSWYKVENNSARDVRGSAVFQPLEDKTLFRYRSIVIPESSMATFIKKFMVSDVEKSVRAIADHIEKLKKEKSPIIAKYSEFIIRSFQGEYVYKRPEK